MHDVTFLRSAVTWLYGRRPSAVPGQDAALRQAARKAGRNPSGFPELWHFAAEHLLLLPLGAVIALVWANTWPQSYFSTAFGLQFLANDVGMVLFFGLIMKEVAEATAPGGVLHPWRRAMFPLVASLGVTAVPALVFVGVVPYFDEPRLVEGWPALLVTDVAFGYFVARAIFGKHPVIPWFVLLGICASAIGVMALAGAVGSEPMRLGILITLMAAAVGVALVFRRARVRSFWPYVLIGGGLSWCGLYFGGFEPALALVPIVPFLPHGARDPGFLVDASPRARDPLSQFELWCRHPAQVALLLFGLVNAGVPLKALDWGTWSMPITLLVAKPLGLMAGVGLAAALGLHLPRRIGWRELVVVGCISMIGFTAALFFATAAVDAGPTLSALKMGALLSVGGALIAFAAAALVRTGRFSPYSTGALDPKPKRRTS
jgi:NhaA family Na+:H+ antiporter